MDVTSLLSSFLGCIIIAFAVFWRLNNSAKKQLKREFDNLAKKNNDNIVVITRLETQLENSKCNLSELSHQLTKEQEISASQKEEFNSKISDMTALVSKLTANNSFLSEKLTTQKTEIEELHKTAQLQFEKIANKLFEEKSSRFAETNKLNIETLLNPLKDDINKFKTKVEDTYDKESKQRFSLEERVKELIEQTNKVSAEANNLASALKGKPQKRGQWGEMILERILESSGLTKDREYVIQPSITNEDGKTLRPDVLLHLPDERLIIIDSKVSLIDYDKFMESESIDEQNIFLNNHVRATKLHIDQLSEKKYDDLESSLDFTMMFIPIEPAYIAALQNDANLWSYAYSKRILLVNPTNLIACLKLISDLWKREWQNKNAMEIVKKGENLYEKFVSFSNSFLEIGKNIEKSQDSYHKALKIMKNGKGNLVQNALQLKNLGLKSSKNISQNLLISSEFDYFEVEP